MSTTSSSDDSSVTSGTVKDNGAQFMQVKNTKSRSSKKTKQAGKRTLSGPDNLPEAASSSPAPAVTALPVVVISPEDAFVQAEVAKATKARELAEKAALVSAHKTTSRLVAQATLSVLRANIERIAQETIQGNLGADVQKQFLQSRKEHDAKFFGENKDAAKASAKNVREHFSKEYAAAFAVEVEILRRDQEKALPSFQGTSSTPPPPSAPKKTVAIAATISPQWGASNKPLALPESKINALKPIAIAAASSASSSEDEGAFTIQGAPKHVTPATEEMLQIGKALSSMAMSCAKATTIEGRGCYMHLEGKVLTTAPGLAEVTMSRSLKKDCERRDDNVYTFQLACKGTIEDGTTVLSIFEHMGDNKTSKVLRDQWNAPTTDYYNYASVNSQYKSFNSDTIYAILGRFYDPITHKSRAASAAKAAAAKASSK